MTKIITSATNMSVCHQFVNNVNASCVCAAIAPIIILTSTIAKVRKNTSIAETPVTMFHFVLSKSFFKSIFNLR